MPRGLNDNLEFILIDPCNAGFNYEMIHRYADNHETTVVLGAEYDFWCNRVDVFQGSLDRYAPGNFSKKIKMLNGTLKCYYDDCEFYGSDFHEFYDSEFFSDSAYSEGEFGDCG